jgi:hypothetical protein
MVRVLVATALREALEMGGWRRSNDSSSAEEPRLAVPPREELECCRGPSPTAYADLEATDDDARLVRIAESRDRLATPTSMPAVGLCFVEAGYPPEYRGL